MKRLMLIAALLVFASFVVVLARSSFLGTFNTLYSTTDTTLDTCVTCHNSGYTLNSYASDFNAKRLQLGSVSAGLQAVEAMDSDKDGDTNKAEIDALTFPGNPNSSLPVEDVTWGKIKSLFE